MATRRRFTHATALLVGLLSLTSPALLRAQGLAIRSYDIADGLPNSRIVCLRLDRRGFLWIGTWEGLSRFDGTEFVNYGTAQGLGNPVINTIAEAPDGAIWVGTNGAGIARLTGDSGRAQFVHVRLGDDARSNVVSSLTFARDGSLWCGTDQGVFRCHPVDAERTEVTPVLLQERTAWSQTMLVDQPGTVWCGAQSGPIGIADGKVENLGTPDGAALGPVAALLAGSTPSTLIVAFDGGGTFELDTATRSWRDLGLALPQAASVRGLLRDSSGDLWIASNKGLLRCHEGKQELYTTAQRLTDNAISALCEDRDHNLWIGTWSGGLCKWSGDAFASFTMQEGMPERVVTRLCEARSGAIVACTFHGLAEVRDNQVRVVPGSLTPPFARLELALHQDQRGDWWLGTAQGLYRFDGPELQLEHGKLLGPEEGIAQSTVHGAIYEDASGVIWVSTREPKLYWYDPRASDHVHFEGRDVTSRFGLEPVREYLRDPSGALWLAPIRGLLRLQHDDVTRVAIKHVMPGEQVRTLMIDHRGWLWLGSRYDGLACSKDYAGATPSFLSYTTRNGLMSDACWSIAEDRMGRMYFATSRGVDRLDPDTGQLKHYSAADGLAGDIVNHCLCDRRGDLWFGTSGGLSRFTPQPEDPPVASPPIYITRIQIAGDDLALPDTGVVRPEPVTVPAHRNSVAIHFAGVSFRGEHQLYYQYRLVGIDEDWSPLTPQRSVHYARLAPGSYAFEVRAVHASRVTSPEPAVFRFRIDPPIYLRWWFLLATALVIAMLATAWHRLRVQRILALESIRRQIATDIHDDLGSGLAQIAILAEVVKRTAAPQTQSYLEQVAQLARSMRDSMSDIVWAVDPRKDRFADLVQRMRQVALNLFEAEGIRVDFRVPHEESFEATLVPPDRRRHLFLIFKEALANVARHAHARHVTIDMALDRHTLRLEVTDDGRGFDPDSPSKGHGIQSLHQRAALLHGTIEVRSSAGHGTTVTLVVPW